MATVTLSDSAKAFLLGDDTQSHNLIPHTHAVILPQQMAEMIDFADTVEVDKQVVSIGGIPFDCLITTLKKQGKEDVIVHTNIADFFSKNPRGEWTFRGERLIKEVLAHQAIAHWG